MFLQLTGLGMFGSSDRSRLLVVLLLLLLVLLLVPLVIIILIFSPPLLPASHESAEPQILEGPIPQTNCHLLRGTDPLREFQGAQGRARKKAGSTCGP